MRHIDCYDCKNCDESMHNEFNSDCYEVNRVKHPKRRNYNKAKTAIRLIKTATIAKTAINRCITRKHPEDCKPNVHERT